MDNSNELLEQMTAEAIQFIREHEPPEGYFVGFSGGKDSIVTLDIVKKSGVKYEAFYSMTLIDPPEIVRFIKENYPEVGRIKPRLTFWQGMLKYGPPYHNQRWCCKVLKKVPARINPLKHRIMGIRAEESWRRKRLQRISFFAYYNVWLHYPVFEWSSADIWDYIKNEGLKYPPLYDEGFKRIGCVVCPFIVGKTLLKNKQRWPGHYRILEKYLNKYWEKDKERDIPKIKLSYENFMCWPEWRGKFPKSSGKETL